MLKKRAVLFLCGVLSFWLVQVAWSAEPIKFTIVSDGGGKPEFADVLNQISTFAGGPGEFLVSPGDMNLVWNTRTMLDTAYGSDFAWYNTPGNHEYDDPANIDWLRNYNWNVFGRPINSGPSGGENTTYSFDAGPVHIVMLNEFYENGTDVGTDDQSDVVPALREWLANDLANTDKRWKLVFGHEPAWSYTDEQDGSRRHFDDALMRFPSSRDAFWNVLNQYDVTAYVHGSTHMYNRVKPLYQGGKVWQISDACVADYRSELPEQGNYSTWITVNADDNDISFETYRDLHEDPNRTHTLVDSWSIMDPSRDPLPPRSHSPGTLRGTYKYVDGPLPNGGPDAGQGAGPFPFDASSAFGDEAGSDNYIEWTMNMQTNGVLLEFDLGGLFPITEISSAIELPDNEYGTESMRVAWSADGVNWSGDSAHIHRIVGEFNFFYTVSDFEAMDGTGRVDSVVARYFRIRWPKNGYTYGHDSIRINEVYFEQVPEPATILILIGGGLIAWLRRR